MSNLSQFYGSGFPMGSSLSQLYDGDLITRSDGSQWLTNTPTAPFSYTSQYSYLPDPFLSPHPLLSGPENGLFRFQFNPIIAYSSSSGVYCTNSFIGNSVTGYYYYTSADGVNWTQRTFPNPTINYALIVFVAGKFIAFASTTTTNGAIYSTDAISWTSVTIPSISAPQDIFYNGTRLVVIGSTTAAAYSSDLGVTWTLTTLPSNTLAANFPGSGVITWSQSAGLFLIATSTAGTYYTSPDGITWTSRTVAPSIYNSFIGTQVKFASSPSKIVAMGLSGFFLTSTDGLNWTSGSISGIAANTQCVQSYYDGTRFVVRYGNATYYSTDGTTWTTAKFIGSSSGTSSFAYSNGILFVFCSVAANVPTKAIKVQNVSLTSPQTISVPITASTPAGTGSTVIYYRIR